tara:strand:+ start:1380 stop:1598 length:219 start_codon:yes stop_codon:yes gene_type:complete
MQTVQQHARLQQQQHPRLQQQQKHEHEQQQNEQQNEQQKHEHEDWRLLGAKRVHMAYVQVLHFTCILFKFEL